MARSRRPLPAALVALGLLFAVTQPLPAQAAGPPSSAAARTSPAAVAAPAVVARAPRPVKGISMQQLLPYWGANARGIAEIGRGDANVFQVSEREIASAQCHHAASVRDAARVQQYGVGHREDGDVGADTERERQDGNHGKAGRLAQLTHCVA